MQSVADLLPESASQFPSTSRALLPDSPWLPTAAPLQSSTTRAFGTSADAAHLPPDLLTPWRSAQPASDSYPACCTPASEGTSTAPVAPVAPALPVALVQIAADGLLCPDFSNLPGPLAQSACAQQHVPHCIPELSTRVGASRPAHALRPRPRSAGPSPSWHGSAPGCLPCSPGCRECRGACWCRLLQRHQPSPWLSLLHPVCLGCLTKTRLPS